MEEENRNDPKYVETKVKAMRKAVYYFYVYFFLGLAITFLLSVLFKRNAIPTALVFIIISYIARLYLKIFYLRCPVCNKNFFFGSYFWENFAFDGCSVPLKCKCCGANLDYHNK